MQQDKPLITLQYFCNRIIRPAREKLVAVSDSNNEKWSLEQRDTL